MKMMEKSRGGREEDREKRISFIFFYLVGNVWPINYCGYFQVAQRKMYRTS